MDSPPASRFSRCFHLPSFLHPSSSTLRATGVYVAGALYALGFLCMLDADLFSRSAANPSNPFDPGHPGYPGPGHPGGGGGHGGDPGDDGKLTISLRDWAPFLIASLGMLIINTVDKSVLAAHSLSFIPHSSSSNFHTHHANTSNPPNPPTTTAAANNNNNNCTQSTTHAASAGDRSFSGEKWQARAILILGFACLFLGLATSGLLLVFKYVLPDIKMPALGMGVLGVVGSGCVALSGGVLWGAQNMEDEYSYSLQL